MQVLVRSWVDGSFKIGRSGLSTCPQSVSATWPTVSRVQRFQAARLGMMRSWVQDRILRLMKTDTTDMRADILSKPVNPSALFGPKQRLLLTGRI